MNDRLFINARDTQGAKLHIGVKNGCIASLGQTLPSAENGEIVNLEGHVVLPGFVDGHIHLDKSFVGDHWRPHQPAASLRERLAIEKRELASAISMVDRADALIRQAASFGTIAMRCHVDVDATTALDHLHAVMEAREKWKGLMDIELVAFPQAGVISCPGTADVLENAMREGATVVGGIDPSTLDGDPEGQLNIIFGLAEKHRAKIDIHLHEPGELCLAQLRRIATRTQALGMQGLVSVSHAYGLGDVTNSEVFEIAEVLRTANISIMTNAPGDRAFPPVLELRRRGVRVFAGNDNIQDAWWPYGNGDMLQRAMLVGYRSGFYTDKDLLVALDMATHASAQVMGKDNYGLKVGNEACFVTIQTQSAAAAVATVPYKRTIVRHGQIWSATGSADQNSY